MKNNVLIIAAAVLSASALQAIAPQDWFNNYLEGKLEENDQACLRDIINGSIDSTPAAADAALNEVINGIKADTSGDPVDQASIDALQALIGAENLAAFAGVITTSEECSDEQESE